MSNILDLREKRAKSWDTAKAFLDTQRGADGLISAEAAASYDKVEADIMNLGREISRLERQEAIDMEMSQPTSAPITARQVIRMERLSLNDMTENEEVVL